MLFLQEAGCNWAATDSTLDAEDIDVCKMDVMVQICQYDLESSFVSEKMAAGDANWEEAEFLHTTGLSFLRLLVKRYNY